MIEVQSGLLRMLQKVLLFFLSGCRHLQAVRFRMSWVCGVAIAMHFRENNKRA